MKTSTSPKLVILFAAMIIIMAVQSRTVLRLKDENRELQGARKQSEQTRRELQQATQAITQHELEAQSLRAEILTLRSELQTARSELMQATNSVKVAASLFSRATYTVRVTNQFVAVSGEVIQPSNVTWSKGLTLTNAIQMAGGFTEFAAKSRVAVRRRNGVQERYSFAEILTSAAENPDLEPGDVVEVPRRIF